MSSTPHSARALSSCHQDGVLLSGTVMSSEETTTSSFLKLNSTQPTSTPRRAFSKQRQWSGGLLLRIVDRVADQSVDRVQHDADEYRQQPDDDQQHGDERIAHR